MFGRANRKNVFGNTGFKTFQINSKIKSTIPIVSHLLNVRHIVLGLSNVFSFKLNWIGSIINESTLKLEGLLFGTSPWNKINRG